MAIVEKLLYIRQDAPGAFFSAPGFSTGLRFDAEMPVIEEPCSFSRLFLWFAYLCEAS